MRFCRVEREVERRRIGCDARVAVPAVARRDSSLRYGRLIWRRNERLDSVVLLQVVHVQAGGDVAVRQRRDCPLGPPVRHTVETLQAAALAEDGEVGVGREDASHGLAAGGRKRVGRQARRVALVGRVWVVFRQVDRPVSSCWRDCRMGSRRVVVESRGQCTLVDEGNRAHSAPAGGVWSRSIVSPSGDSTANGATSPEAGRARYEEIEPDKDESRLAIWRVVAAVWY